MKPGRLFVSGPITAAGNVARNLVPPAGSKQLWLIHTMYMSYVADATVVNRNFTWGMFDSVLGLCSPMFKLNAFITAGQTKQICLASGAMAIGTALDYFGSHYSVMPYPIYGFIDPASGNSVGLRINVESAVAGDTLAITYLAEDILQ